MENIQELMSALENDNYFEASCVYKDVCLKNYKYKPPFFLFFSFLSFFFFIIF